jgi:hypothetical protein
MTTGKSLELLTDDRFDSWRDSVTLCIVAKKGNHRIVRSA